MTRTRAMAAGAAVVVALLATAPATAAEGTVEVRRIAGEDRFATAAALAVDRFRSASDVVLARADDPADALAGSYVAGSHIGPVLLAETRRVPDSTMGALRALGVHKVRVLGGTSALGPEVEAQVQAAGMVVERVSGSDRYGTAAAVARNSGIENIGTRSSLGATALLANGTRPADALSAGPLAFGRQWPVLLTETGALPMATQQALDNLGIRHVVVVGGTAVVDLEVVAALEATGRTVERVAGLDREATAAAVADLLVALGEQVTRVEVAASASFADALALGSHAAPNAPVLLCRALDDCGDATLGWIAAHAASVRSVVVAGGTGVIGAPAEAQLRAAATTG